jgi:hypothetical protein
MEIKLWAIIDTQKTKPRFCYADAKKTKGTMAFFDKKPVISNKWKDVKKVVRVTVEYKG